MEIYENLEAYVPHKGGAYVALGFFDGVHTGHRAVIGGCVRDSGELPAVVLTFRESPAAALGRPVPPLLSDNEYKTKLLASIGVQEVVFADFTEIKDMDPAAFVSQILRDRLCAKHVYCGYNYRFGKNGSGDTAALQELCAEQGIEVRIQPPVVLGGEQVSSSRIRALLAGGEIAVANELLGYRYAVAGRIGNGNHIGTAMGFPTVNISFKEGIAVPRFGVYASTIEIDAERYSAATNIGVHPTVGENNRPLCESFLLDFGGGDLYGKRAVCELTSFIRPERRFGSVEELTAQVKRDCHQIRKMKRG